MIKYEKVSFGGVYMIWVGIKITTWLAAALFISWLALTEIPKEKKRLRKAATILCIAVVALITCQTKPWL